MSRSGRRLNCPHGNPLRPQKDPGCDCEPVPKTARAKKGERFLVMEIRHAKSTPNPDWPYEYRCTGCGEEWPCAVASKVKANPTAPNQEPTEGKG